MKRQAEVLIPSGRGHFNMILYADSPDDPNPHIALVHPQVDINQSVAVRIHSECITGDLFGSKRCDCGPQLFTAMEMAQKECGVIIYLRQEGRGIGIINKIKAYNLQDKGLNTFEANVHLGLEPDARTYDKAIEILHDLQIHNIRLMTNNPDKIFALNKNGISITERIPLVIPAISENFNYLKAKQVLMGHLLGLDDPS